MDKIQCEFLLGDLMFLEDLLYCLIREGDAVDMDKICDVHTTIKNIIGCPKIISEATIVNDEWINNLFALGKNPT